MNAILATWTADDVVKVLAAVGGFITLTLTPFLFWLFGQIKSIKAQNAGQQKQIDNAHEGIVANSKSIVEVAKPSPSPEVMAKAMAEANTPTLTLTVPMSPSKETPQ